MEVKVNVIEGKELLATDINFKCDPYVKVSVSGSEETYQTEVVKSNRNPNWDETFIFNVPLEAFDESALNITVFDEDRGSDDLIGEASQPLNIFKLNEEIHHSIPLTHQVKDKEVSAGSIEVNITISEIIAEEEEQKHEEEEAKQEEEQKREEEEKIIVVAEEEEKKEEEEQKHEEEEKKEEEEQKHEEEEQKHEEEEQKHEEEEEKIEEEEAQNEEEANNEEEEKEEDERIKLLKERIDQHHQRLIALEKGEEPIPMKSRSAAKVPTSPRKSRAKKASKPAPKKEEEEEMQEVEETEEEREAREQKDAEAEEKLDKEVSAIKKKAMKKYNSLLSKYKFIADNEKVIKKQKKQQEDAKNGNLESMSVDQLKNLYLKLKKESKNLDKEISSLKKELNE